MKFNLINIKYSKNDIKRELHLPNFSSKKLAEFIGILTGDGYLNYYPKQNKYLLEIAGDSSKDKSYLTGYVTDLIEDLFNISSSFFIRKDQNSIYLRIISKALILYLIQIGFKRGRKGQIGVPDWILSNINYFLSFLKGIADTDCGLYFRKEYSVISFKSKSKILVEHISNVLIDVGFVFGKINEELKLDKRGYNNSKTYCIKLYGTRNLNLWLKLIGFRNKRHLNKLERMGTRGFEPRI